MFRAQSFINLILIRTNRANNCGAGLLQFAMSDDLVRNILLDGLSGCARQNSGKVSSLRFLDRLRRTRNRVFFAIPEEWRREKTQTNTVNSPEPKLIYYSDSVPVSAGLNSICRGNEISNSWFVVSSGRFATRFDPRLLERLLVIAGADVLAVNIESELLSEQERVRLKSDGKVAGFRRIYSDLAEYGFVPDDWPDHLFIRGSVLEHILSDGNLPLSFSDIVESCRSKLLALRAINMGGAILDLETEQGLLDLCRISLSERSYLERELRDSHSIADNARIVGNVLLGKNVTIGENATIVGPVVIGDNVKVESGAIIHSSIIESETCVPTNQYFQNRIVRDSQHGRQNIAGSGDRDHGPSDYLRYDLNYWHSKHDSFRHWPVFSYPRCIKRIADCLVATIVLVLFAPLMPFVALAIKLTSKGPVFYGDRRQGLHGKEFDCLKFRTMITGAHAIQEKLRVVSQVDGPQFKMDDDPRISTVGRFLRETYIDEIPQFFNVLFGQMSVVGPRPSPVAENTQCPCWRDARLSVRPGITGLWQLYRTRQPMRDFQEWIYYDLEYVRNLSLWTDLKVCWLTTKKLLANLISQF